MNKEEYIEKLETRNKQLEEVVCECLCIVEEMENEDYKSVVGKIYNKLSETQGVPTLEVVFEVLPGQDIKLIETNFVSDIDDL